MNLRDYGDKTHLVLYLESGELDLESLIKPFKKLLRWRNTYYQKSKKIAEDFYFEYRGSKAVRNRLVTGLSKLVGKELVLDE